MFETYNSSGYDLYQPIEDVDHWVFDDRGGTLYRGKLKEVIQYMMSKFNFGFDDIEEGLNLLADNFHKDHNAVHMGIFKSVIFTFNYEEKYGKRAS